MAFTIKTRIPYYECDETGRLRVSAAARLMQNVAGIHVETLGIDYDKWVEINMVFLLSQTFLEVTRLPKGGEEVTVTTTPTMTKGAKFFRDVIIADANGERCASFITIWILVEPTTRKVLRPGSFPFDLPFEPSIALDKVTSTVFPKAENPITEGSREISPQYGDIDNNGHVNNSIYIEYACNMIPYELLVEKGVKSVAVSYQNEARPEELITLNCAKENSSYFFYGTKAGSPCFKAVITLGEK